MRSQPIYRILKATDDQKLTVPAGKQWTILSGAVYHVTGTTTDAELNDAGGNMYDRLSSIGTSFGTGYFPLFCFILSFAITAETAAGVFTSQNYFSMGQIGGEHILREGSYFRVNGDAGCFAILQVLEEDA